MRLASATFRRQRRATLPDMDSSELDILTQLDSSLRIVDPKVEVLEALLSRLASPETVGQLKRCYNGVLVAWGERCIVNTAQDQEALAEALHASIPADIDPEVIALLDARLFRLIEIGRNIASGGPPLA